VPDVELPVDTYEPIEINLERQGYFFSFSVEYVSAHPELTIDFELSDELLEEFRAYVEGKDFEYSTRLELEFEALRERIADQGKEELFEEALADLEAIAAEDKADDFEESEAYIRRAIKRNILRNKFGERGVYEQVILREDPGIQEALRLLRSSDDYSRLLSGPDVHERDRG